MVHADNQSVGDVMRSVSDRNTGAKPHFEHMVPTMVAMVPDTRKEEIRAS
mgnify:CR=1 FL=1